MSLLWLLASAALAASKAHPRFSAASGHCGAEPNCVSSLDPRQGRHMEPWSYEGTRAEALARLEKLLRHEFGARVYPGGVDYLHAEFRSLVLRMINDVEFYLPIDKPVIHFRSSSRVGVWDFGRNRRRMTMLGEKFVEQAPERKKTFQFPAPY